MMQPNRASVTNWPSSDLSHFSPSQLFPSSGNVAFLSSAHRLPLNHRHAYDISQINHESQLPSLEAPAELWHLLRRLYNALIASSSPPIHWLLLPACVHFIRNSKVKNLNSQHFVRRPTTSNAQYRFNGPKTGGRSSRKSNNSTTGP